jgi:hypothetical protein
VFSDQAISYQNQASGMICKPTQIKVITRTKEFDTDNDQEQNGSN